MYAPPVLLRSFSGWLSYVRDNQPQLRPATSDEQGVIPTSRETSAPQHSTIGCTLYIDKICNACTFHLWYVSR